MVQFSLKLEDNRVEKWSSHYLDYRKLKKTIKQLTRSQNALNCRRRRASAPSGGIQSGDGHVTLLPSNEATGLLSSTGIQGTQQGLRGVGFSSVVEMASFEATLKEEIDKVERFFVREVESLKSELAELDPAVPINAIVDGDGEQDYPQRPTDGDDAEEAEPWVMRAKPALKKKEEDSLKRALLDLYRDLTLLQNFAIVNYTAVVKITKKYGKQVVATNEGNTAEDSVQPVNALNQRMLAYAHQQDFYKTQKLKVVRSACVGFYAGVFCGGNVAQAKGLMLPQKTDERIDLAQFQLGYRMGMAAVLAFWIIWDCCFEPHDNDPDMSDKQRAEDAQYWKVSVFLQPAFPVYRAMAGILVLRWCWGLTSLVWGRARINYIYLFDMDPRSVSAPLEVFNNVAAETVVYLANLLVYYKLLLHRFPPLVPAGSLPLMLCVYVMFQTVYPVKKSWEFWKVIFRVMVAPLAKVEFFATYVADVMTSSVKTTQDIAWTFCFFLSGDFLLDLEDYHVTGGSWQRSGVYINLAIPALCILPLWLRFQQCLRRYHDTQKRFPHLANCLKYSMAFTVALFGVFTPPNSTTTAVKIAWFVMYVVSTLYTFAWDVLQDWGLGHPNYGFLRKKRLFARPEVYYAAVVVDLMLRFNWLYSLIPPGHSPLPFLHSSTIPVFVTTVVILCEFMRRTMWGFFRVENEHLNNTEGYRSTDHVPLHFTTSTARSNEPRKKGALVIGEVLGVTVAGVAMAAAAVVVARHQAEASP